MRNDDDGLMWSTEGWFFTPAGRRYASLVVGHRPLREACLASRREKPVKWVTMIGPCSRMSPAAMFHHRFSLVRLDKSIPICHTHRVENLIKTEESMALDAHVTELSDKHRALEKQIENEMARPSADDIEISKLKREKLRIKDELERLKAEVSQVA
jgi:hypothetical protein